MSVAQFIPVDPLSLKVLEIIAEHTEPREYAGVVHDFKNTLHQAMVDWARFKAAEPFYLFNPDEQNYIRSWFHDLPNLWDAIKVNYLDDSDRDFYELADKWISQFRVGPGVSGLGLPVLLIAGVLIVAAIGGVAAAIWAVGYVKEQSNVTRLIDETVAGNISDDVLQAAVEKETAGANVFGDIKGILQTLLFVGVGIAAVKYGLPLLQGAKNKG